MTVSRGDFSLRGFLASLLAQVGNRVKSGPRFSGRISSRQGKCQGKTIWRF